MVIDELSTIAAKLIRIAAQLPEQEKSELMNRADDLIHWFNSMAVVIYDRTVDENQLCPGCQHNRTWAENYPQGDRMINENMRECVASSPSECPAVREALQMDPAAVPAFLRRQGG